MNLLREDFKDGEPISAVGTGWLNAVGRFINRLTGKNGIRVTKYGQFPTIELDLQSAGEKTTPSPTTGTSIAPDDLGALTYRDLPAWKAPDAMTGLDNATPAGWERGKTAYRNGYDVDREHPAVGCSITVCTHACMRTISGQTKHELLFARMEFDENGMLVRVVPVANWYKLN